MKAKLFLIGWLSLLLVACGSGARGVEPPVAPSPTASEALREDAAMMAGDLGISVDEAVRRIQLQDAIGQLGAALEAQEAETFAGLWIQHEPEYRVIAAFTEDGETTIRPYLEGSPLADEIEVQTADLTLVELMTLQQEVHQLLTEVGVTTDSSINIQANRVELYTTDQQRFDEAFQAADATLPDHVTVISTYEPLAEPPAAITPAPDVAFPQLQVRDNSFMEALLIGELVVENGCLRVRSDNGDSELVVWQPDYFLTDNDGRLEMLDRDGEVVARVGEKIYLGGGNVPASSLSEDQLQAPVPAACGMGSSYWRMGQFLPEEFRDNVEGP